MMQFCVIIIQRKACFFGKKIKRFRFLLESQLKRFGQIFQLIRISNAIQGHPV